ncbi:MAG: GrpB family protein [Synechococcales cyanobacterium M58_A2018_015]|nr:GrpB family protein [Synechococcales cyanobacterium M58_A2018_015]
MKSSAFGCTHIVESGSVLLERLLARDYLREHPDEALRYAQLKRHLAELRIAGSVSIGRQLCHALLSYFQDASTIDNLKAYTKI